MKILKYLIVIVIAFSFMVVIVATPESMTEIDILYTQLIVMRASVVLCLSLYICNLLNKNKKL